MALMDQTGKDGHNMLNLSILISAKRGVWPEDQFQQIGLGPTYVNALVADLITFGMYI